MIKKEDIPEIAICHVCGEPMKLVDLSELAESLGYQVASGSYALECHGFEQTIDDPREAKRVLKLLLEYHAVKAGNVS